MRKILLLCLALLFASDAFAGLKDVNVAVLTDGPSDEGKRLGTLFRNELKTLTAGSFNIRFRETDQLAGAWTTESLRPLFEKLQSEGAVDMIIVLGLVSGRLAVSTPMLGKPTFVPYLPEVCISKARKKNLNYLTVHTDFGSELDMFLKAVKFRKLALLLDGSFRQMGQAELARATGQARERGVELSVIYNTGINEDLAAKIPAGVEAVMIAPLPRLDETARRRLASALLEKTLFSYSPFDFSMAEKGVLLARSSAFDNERRARLTSLNILEVLKGEKPEDQPVSLDDKRRLRVNMASASRLGVFLPFSLLNEAELINENVSYTGRLTISEAVREAVKANLSLIAGELGVKGDGENVREVRSALFPQISVDLDYTRRDEENDYVKVGSYAENGTEGGISLKQLIFSEKTLARLEIQKQLHTAAMEQQRMLELEVAEQAAGAFLNVLVANTNRRIHQDDLGLTKTNLELARGRVAAGASDMSDVYYWESQISKVQQRVLAAEAEEEKARDALNRMMDRPIHDRYFTVAATPEELGIAESLSKLLAVITNEARFRRLSEYLVDTAEKASPELQQLEARRKAGKRRLVSEKRSRWVPDVHVYADLTHTFDETREDYAGVDMADQTVWQVGLGLTLPVFQGGAISARVARAGYELQQLDTCYNDSRKATAQNVLEDLHALRASYPAIRLSSDAAEAAGKSFEIIRENYAEGTRPMTDLLTAQNTRIAADLTSANAVYGFMRDLIGLQKDLGSSGIFLDKEAHTSFMNGLWMYLSAAVPVQ